MLGNLTIRQMEEHLGVGFPEPFRMEFANNVASGKWHCFLLVCGDRATALMVQEALSPLQMKMTGSMRVAIHDHTK